MSIYRRRVGAYFSLMRVEPWQDDDARAFLDQVSFAVPEDRCFDIVFDHRFCLFKTAGQARDPQPLAVLQSDGVLTVAGRDVASLAIFTLSVAIDTISEAFQRFSPLQQRVKRLVLQMPSKECRTFVYLDWAVLLADPSRVDLAVKVGTSIFLPRLALDFDIKEQKLPSVDKTIAQAQEPVVPMTIGIATSSGAAVEPVKSNVDVLSVLADVNRSTPLNAPTGLPKNSVERRKLTMILPLSDDLRTSFLGFGYSVGAGIMHGRALEIGAFRRNLRSSYSRLMGGTDVIDIKAQPPAAEVILDLENKLSQLLANRGDLSCFIGSEVVSVEVLEIFRKFAAANNLAIHAVVCAATPPSAPMMEVIHNGLASSDLRVHTLCFLPPGETSGFVDAAGRQRGYFGVPPVEGQSMARCMEFRSNVEDPAFIVPASVPPRETHALERFVNAFRPLREGLIQQPAA